MDKLAKLVCGNYDNLGRLSDILGHLQKQITFYASKSIECLTQEDEQFVINILPYHARVILELSLTALIGRIDPFRLLVVERIQSDKDYDFTKKIESAIRWSGDFIAPSEPKKLDDQLKLTDLNRSVIARHMETVFWKPAFEIAKNTLGEHRYQSEWIKELFYIDSQAGKEKSQEDNRLSTYFSGNLRRIYSTLSKGVHQELLIPNHMLDSTTIETSLVDVFKYISQMGLLSHFIPVVHAKIDWKDSVKLVEEIEVVLESVKSS